MNLANCWEDYVDGIDFGDDDELGDPVALDPDPPPPEPTRIHCDSVHPLLNQFAGQLVLHQLQGGQVEDFLDELRCQVATCLGVELAHANLMLAGGTSPGDTAAVTFDDLRFLAYSTITYAFAAADYVNQHFHG